MIPGDEAGDALPDLRWCPLGGGFVYEVDLRIYLSILIHATQSHEGMNECADRQTLLRLNDHCQGQAETGDNSSVYRGHTMLLFLR